MLKLNKHSKTKSIINLSLSISLIFLCSFSVINGQEEKNSDIKSKNIKTPLTPQTTGDKIEFKNESGNAIITITDEGDDAGSIIIPQSLPSITTNKLYNEAGTLKFNGISLGAGGADSLNQLSDAKYDGSSLFIGEGAGANDDDSDNRNTAVGKDALNSNTTGNSNTANGYYALKFNMTGTWNTANGSFALQNNSNGSLNTAYGYMALNRNSNGNNNVGIGYSANRFNLEGSNNTIIGSEAGSGSSVHSKSGNVFLGYQSGFNELGNDKLYIENSNSSTPLIWGDFAEDSLRINGNLHLTGNLTIDGEGIGATELNDLTDAKKNGFSNYGIGSDALASFQSGVDNTSVGYSALPYLQTGIGNVGFGSGAFSNLQTGNHNTAVGTGVFSGLGGGSRNTAIGYQAGAGIGAIDGGVFIGYQAGQSETTSNKLYIENSFSETPLIWGDFENDNLGIHGTLCVGRKIPSEDDLVQFDAAAGQRALRVTINSATKLRVLENGGVSIGVNRLTPPANGLFVKTDIEYEGSLIASSDRRLKNNFKSIENSLEKISEINGLYYDWNNEEFPERDFSEERQIGVIAQEVEKVFPELVKTNEDGYKSVDYVKLTPILLEAVKELNRQNKEIKNANSDLENRLSKLEKLLEGDRFSSSSN